MARHLKHGAFIAGLLSLGLLAFPGNPVRHPLFERPPLLLAPMMDLTRCILAQPGIAFGGQADWLARCSGPHGSSAHLVESTLRYLQPQPPETAAWQLGYTLQVPLLALLHSEQNVWQVNQQAIDNIVRTVRDNPRPLVLYLFSTHFSVNAPIEPVLAHDPTNIAYTPQGPLPVDTYYGQPVYPWSVARTDNPVTQYRVKVTQALLQSLCTLPRSARSRIRGITLLGEVHQLFPNFESGMGFGGVYQVSDYSAASVAGFRRHLQNRFTGIQALNRELGSDYPSFDAITPPDKDIRREPLRRYQEHLDAYAAGKLPITGWVYAPDTPSSAQAVKIYLDGKHIADAPVHLSRQDVRAAHPEFNTADLGWRHDLDYSRLPTGIHRIDVALAQPGRALVHLASRTISIMDKWQNTPVAVPAAPLPAMQPQPANIADFTDEPRDQASYYFNPLAREWQVFREAQVLQYLQFFNRIVGQSCLSDTPRYTHQVVPQFNPGWDNGKFAVKASLQPVKSLHTGVSLYGEASYGRSFAEWFKQIPRDQYGITELHPLQAMSVEDLRGVLNQHRNNGARFASFFLETRWQEQRIPIAPNLFSFDPDNPRHGSDKLSRSMKALLAD